MDLDVTQITVFRGTKWTNPVGILNESIYAGWRLIAKKPPYNYIIDKNLDSELYQPVSQGKLPFQAANYRWSHCSGKQPKPKRNLQDKLAPRSWS